MYAMSILRLSIKKSGKKIGKEIRDVEKVCCNAKEKFISGEIRFKRIVDTVSYKYIRTVT